MTNTNTTNIVPAPRFSVTDPDGASAVLTLVRLTFACAGLDAKYPYLVQVTAGPEMGDDFDGLYNLDGERVDVGDAYWEIVAEAPASVIEHIATAWEDGSAVVKRIGDANGDESDLSIEWVGP